MDQLHKSMSRFTEGPRLTREFKTEQQFCTVIISVVAGNNRQKNTLRFWAYKNAIRVTSDLGWVGDLLSLRIYGRRFRLNKFLQCPVIRRVIWSEAIVPGQQTHMAKERVSGKPDSTHHVRVTETEEIHEGTYEFRERMKTVSPVPIA